MEKCTFCVQRIAEARIATTATACRSRPSPLARPRARPRSSASATSTTPTATSPNASRARSTTPAARAEHAPARHLRSADPQSATRRSDRHERSRAADARRRVEPARDHRARMTNRVSIVPCASAAWRWWWIAFAVCGAAGLGGVGRVGWSFYRGIRVWGNDWPVMWGFPILDYVWWIAIASGGTFVSAFFFLVRVEWRTSINRLAETMTLFAAACAGIYPILHLGRPWFFYWLFPYPNTMTLWPQWKRRCCGISWRCSPMWSPRSCSGSSASCRTWRRCGTARRPRGAGRLRLLRHGLPRHRPQWRHLKATYGTLAAIMAPLVVSVHSRRRARLRRRRDAGLAFDRIPALLRLRRALVGPRRRCCC